MKYFFWIAFAVFLAASIPHVAYFFASFEPSEGHEGMWWWGVSYAIAISIDVTVYLLSYTAFKRYRKYRTARAVWQHWLLIVICTFFSWAVNWAYAKQFHSPFMLSSAELAAPWLSNLFPFMASAFPLLGIVYTLMAETISETEEHPNLLSLPERIKQKQLAAILQQQALASEEKQPSAQAKVQEESIKEEVKPSSEPFMQPITGQFIALDTTDSENPQFSPLVSSAKRASENNPDKLQMAMEAIKADPKITDEVLAGYLALKRPASARFWRLKALEILQASEKEEREAGVSERNAWATTGVLANGSVAKR